MSVRGAGPDDMARVEREGSDVLGIVVVNFASSALLEANLVGHETPGCRVVVVDNYSSREERERIRELAGRRGWSLVECDDNPGFGVGVNRGAAAARELGCRALLLLNPDVEVSTHVVEALSCHVLLDPWVLVSPRLVDLTGRTVFSGSSLDLTDGRIRSSATAARRPGGQQMGWLTAACLAVSMELWERASGFAEDYFMYWEDVDFNVRCLAAGARVVLRDDLVAVHDQGGTQGPGRGRAKSALYYRFNAANRLRFGVHHLSRDRLWRWVRATPRVTYEIWLHGGRRQLLHHPGRAAAALAGGLSGTALALANVVRGLSAVEPLPLGEVERASGPPRTSA